VAAARELPALAVGVSTDGAVETRALGCDESTCFRVASVTKPMVAVLALSLLDPDGPTGVWPDDVRVRHLLAHTSGFDCELPDGDQTRFGDGDDALARCIAELTSIRRFLGVDQVWSYANSGYWLAGHLAAERTGTTFEDALAAHVLGPAGLAATSFSEPDVPGTGRDLPRTQYPRARRPSGGLTSTVRDLLRFGRFLLANPLFARLRHVQGKTADGVYGLGLHGERVGGVEVWGHRGSYGGFEASLLAVPGREAVFAALTNSERGGPALRRIEDEFFAATLGARRVAPAYVSLEQSCYEEHVGTYRNSSDSYEVRHEGGDELVVVRGDGDDVVGRAIDERTFVVTGGEHEGERFDFPLRGFGRFGSRLAELVA
jgi:D-alanyl-D-alanine carboxypeptidase